MMIGIGIGLPFAPGIFLENLISAIFAGGNQGAWYSTSQALTAPWYQDSAATAPVTAVEQPVGNARDRSGSSNHATQATAAARPVVSSRVNLLRATETPATWGAQTTGTGTAATATTGIAGAPDGTATAIRIQANLNGGSASAANQSILALDYADLGTLQGLIRHVWIRSNNGLAQTVTLNNNSNEWVQAITTSWQQVSRVTAGINTIMVFGLRGGAGTSDAADFLVWHPQIEMGTTPTRYQRVNTATDYDTAGFPSYLKFDGIDDSLSSPTGGGGTAGFFFCAAVVIDGGAGAVRTLINDQTGLAGYVVQFNAANNFVLQAGNGAAYTSTAVAGPAVGAKTVVTAYDDGANLNVQIGLAAPVSVARPVVTAGTTSVSYAKSNTAAAEYFNGKTYESVYVRNSGLTPSQRQQVQRQVAAAAGIVL